MEHEGQRQGRAAGHALLSRLVAFNSALSCVLYKVGFVAGVTFSVEMLCLLFLCRDAVSLKGACVLLLFSLLGLGCAGEAVWAKKKDEALLVEPFGVVLVGVDFLVAAYILLMVAL